MAEDQRILLLDQSGESYLDLLILLKVSGYEVEYVEDEQRAVNRYQLLRDSELSFDLVIATQRESDLNLRLLANCFERLLLVTKKTSQLSLFAFGEERLLDCRVSDLLAVVASEINNA